MRLVDLAAEPNAEIAEARRLMTICNSCRYCEGLCAVFPAMETRSDFSITDLNYLANLCHGCGACFYDCQYAPPHEFQVNVPAALAKVRTRSFAAYAWPGIFSGLFTRPGAASAGILALCIAGFAAGFFAGNGADMLNAHPGPGSFYELMPHAAMAILFGAAFLYGLISLTVSVRHFWRDIAAGAPATAKDFWQATSDAGRLRYLDGGTGGCMDCSEAPNDRRRIFHHLVFYGFLLCFAATTAATGYHYLLGLEAPYRVWDLPVVLGTLGGLGLVIGSSGLAVEKRRRDPALKPGDNGLGSWFIGLLWLTGVSGLALLCFRETAAMGVLLALHLAAVLSLFVTMPYGKFVHGLYRFASLMRHAGEARSHAPD